VADQASISFPFSPDNPLPNHRLSFFKKTKTAFDRIPTVPPDENKPLTSLESTSKSQAETGRLRQRAAATMRRSA